MSQVISASPSPDVITINALTKSLPDGPSPNVSTPQVDISITPDPSPSPPSNTWFYLKYALVILVLAALGFNLFFAVGDVTESVTSFLSPILSLVGIGVGNTVKGTAQTAAEGGKLALDVAAGTVTTATDLLQGQPTPAKKKVASDADSMTKKMTDKSESERQVRINPAPSADESTSATQRSGKGRKGGFCYIGEESGIRSCLRVSDASMCMSGEIFPSKDICVNPSLRE